MVNCSVSSCKRRSDTSNMRKGGVSYHIFPNDPLWREQWIKFCKKSSHWIPCKNSVICSDHFKKSCWVPLSNKRRKLIEGAVPSLLNTLSEESDSSIDATDSTQEEYDSIILGPGQIPSASQIEKLIDVHPRIRKLKQKLEMQATKIKRLQSKILYIQNKINSAEEKFKKCENDALRYRQIRLKLKRKRQQQAQRLESQIIPSVKTVLIMKKALFNT